MKYYGEIMMEWYCRIMIRIIVDLSVETIEATK
jgi:hypothetical protein